MVIVWIAAIIGILTNPGNRNDDDKNQTDSSRS